MQVKFKRLLLRTKYLGVAFLTLVAVLPLSCGAQNSSASVQFNPQTELVGFFKEYKYPFDSEGRLIDSYWISLATGKVFRRIMKDMIFDDNGAFSTEFDIYEKFLNEAFPDKTIKLSTADKDFLWPFLKNFLSRFIRIFEIRLADEVDPILVEFELGYDKKISLNGEGSATENFGLELVLKPKEPGVTLADVVRKVNAFVSKAKGISVKESAFIQIYFGLISNERAEWLLPKKPPSEREVWIYRVLAAVGSANLDRDYELDTLTHGVAQRGETEGNKKERLIIWLRKSPVDSRKIAYSDYEGPYKGVTQFKVSIWFIDEDSNPSLNSWS